MIKTCVFDNNGNLINIGEWDYQIERVEIEPAEYDNDGKLFKEGVYEERVMNPMPEGAYTEDREVMYSEDFGWREVGWIPSLSETDILRDYVLDVDFRLILMELGI